MKRWSATLALVVTLALPCVAQAQEFGGAPAPAPDPDAGRQGPTTVIDGRIDTVQVKGRGDILVRDERVIVRVPAADSVVEYQFSNRGGTTRGAVMLGDRFVRNEPLPPHNGVPEGKLDAGPIDLVTSWDPAFLPFRVVFRELTVPADVTRIVKRGTAGRIEARRFEMPDPSKLEVDRAVRKGDTLEITAPESAKGEYKVSKVRTSGSLEVDGGLPEGDVSDVTFEVRRTGEFKDLFETEPTFTRITDKPQLPLTYVWPDPKTDTSDVFIEKRFEAGERPYELRMTITVHNFGRQDVRQAFGVRIGGWQHPKVGGGSMFRRPSNILAGSCYAGQDLERYPYPKLLGEKEDTNGQPLAFAQATEWVALDTTYFMTAAVPLNLQQGQCALDALENGVISSTLWTPLETLRSPEKTCTPAWLGAREGIPTCAAVAEKLGTEATASLKDIRAAWQKRKAGVSSDAEIEALNDAWDALKGRQQRIYRFSLFTGPKDAETLAAMGHDLKESMDWGLLGFIAETLHGLMVALEGVFGHWALAIIFLTLIVKTLLLPLTNKAFKSMQAMQKLKPEMDELRKKHEGDREALNREMLALYKRHGVNPLGGCLPMLLQMPIWISLYQTIGNSVELYNAPMGLWIHDMSSPDPYYVMPIVLGGLMLAQAQLTTNTGTMEGFAAKFMKWGMPLMFSVFMIFLPAGLVLYILVNTSLTIIQNLVIRKRMAT